MADRRGIVIPLIILAFIFLTPNPAQLSVDQARTSRTLEDAIEDEQRSLALVQNSTYREDGVGHVNLTGFGVESGFAWDALPLVRGLARKQREYASGEWRNGVGQAGGEGEDEMPLYQNITGLVHGRWVRSQIHELPTPHLNLSHYGPPDSAGGLASQAFDRNVTGEEGDMKMRFHHRHASSASLLDATVHGNVTNLDLEMTFTDQSTEYDLRLIGVYFPATGEAVLTTTSQKFAGIFALPQLTTCERTFEQSRALLNESISRVIQRQIDGSSERLNPWSPTFEAPNEISDPTPACEMVVYLQQLTPATSASTKITSPLLSFLERELRFPTGAFIPKAPEMRFSMLLFSPDCGYLLESDGPPNSFPIGPAPSNSGCSCAKCASPAPHPPAPG